MDKRFELAKRIFGENFRKWLKIPWVMGVAVGSQNNNPCIEIWLLKNKNNEVISEIGDSINGLPIVFVETQYGD